MSSYKIVRRPWRSYKIVLIKIVSGVRHRFNYFVNIKVENTAEI